MRPKQAGQVRREDRPFAQKPPTVSHAGATRLEKIAIPPKGICPGGRGQPGQGLKPALAALARAAGLALALAAAWPLAAAADVAAAPACLGDRQPLTVSSQMPYALVSVGGRQGYFVLDFGASVSSITPSGFQGPVQPAPVPGSADRYDDFVFFGPWGRVQFALQALAPVRGLVAQAGVLGTDFLAQHVYTLDYRGAQIFRAEPGRFCGDAVLAAAGYRPVSTRDYYGSQPAALRCPRAGAASGGCANIPAVPIRIGTVEAVAQLDTGYDDGRQPFSVNINVALFDALRAAGIALQARPELNLQLSTCQAGTSEPVEAWRLPAGVAFGLVDTAGRLLPRGGKAVTLYVKRPPAAAAHCGGIGTWAQPAAQLGASFVAGGALVVDPISARVWLR